MSDRPSFEDAGFLQRVYYIIHGLWVFIGIILPVIVAFAIIGLVLYILFVIALLIGDFLGYVDLDKKQLEWGRGEKKSSLTKEAQTKSPETTTPTATTTTTTTTIDISNQKTRIEMEIKLLEELIQAKQEQLKDLT
jgi:hypothetical protein